MNIINFLYPHEEIIIPTNEDKAVIVDIPQLNIIQGEEDINKFKGDSNITSAKYDLYFHEANIVINSIRKKGTVAFGDGEVNYGQPYFSSLKVYLQTISEETHDYLINKVLLFKKKAVPEIDQLSEETAKQLVDDILKKKLSEDKLNSLNWQMQKQLIISLGNQLSKLLVENGLIYTSLNEPLLSKKKAT